MGRRYWYAAVFCIGLMLAGANARAQQGESKMKCVAVGSKNSVWAVNEQEHVFHWTGSSWEEPTPSLRLKQISVGSQVFAVWGVDNADAIWALSGQSGNTTTWTQIPGGLKHVSIGSSSVIWGVSRTDEIWNFNGGWVSIPGGLCQIDAAADGTVWGVSKDDKIWRRDGNTWTNIPGGLIHVSVGSANQVWGVSRDNLIWQWVNNGWVQVDGGLKQVDVAADGTVWGVNSAGQVWAYTGSGWKEIAPATAKTDGGSLGNNIALGKACTQSSRSEWSGSEQNAVDGVKNGSFGFHTDDEVNPWWQVDLGGAKKLNRVVIFNREDCCPERARTINVLISEDGMNFRNVYAHDGSIFGGVLSGRPLSVALNGAVARYLRLQLNEKNPLHLDEVEVYGEDAGNANPGITVYEHGGFAGASKVITSDWDCTSAMEWNDRISSIRIPKGYKIQVFEHGQFGGASRILTADWSAAENSPQAFNDIISSIKILSYPGAAVTIKTATSDWTSSGYHSESQNGKYTSWTENWRLPAAGKAAILFKATARNDMHIAFSDAARTVDPMYEIVIGGWGNSKCAIRRRSQGPSIAEVAGAVRQPGVADDYWAMVDKDKGVISAGYGTTVGRNVIIETKDANFLNGVGYFALSSWNTPIDYADVRTVPLAEEVPTGPYVRTMQKSYNVGEPIVVEYKNFPGSMTSWITIIPKGKRADDWGDFQYAPQKSGKLEYNLPFLKAGEYEVRGYFSSSDYTVKARYTFTVFEGGY